MGDAKLKRGEKWKTAKDLAIAQKRDKDVEWFDSQEDIVKDIEAYEDSIKPEIKTKDKKTSKVV